ncbi:uncharacterized protein DS421_9g277920 [Arachis hypogaea]|nr:uncharacterized protein DS421_9g277920 [Arachis hypogaea]
MCMDATPHDSLCSLPIGYGVPSQFTSNETLYPVNVYVLACIEAVLSRLSILT